jgi:hypothetical protein
VNIYAAAFLIPVGVMLYIAHGGLKASILSAWAHVAVIYFSLCLFMFTVYFGSSDLGSISKVGGWHRSISQLGRWVGGRGALHGMRSTFGMPSLQHLEGGWVGGRGAWHGMRCTFCMHFCSSDLCSLISKGGWVAGELAWGMAGQGRCNVFASC